MTDDNFIVYYLYWDKYWKISTKYTGTERGVYVVTSNLLKRECKRLNRIYFDRKRAFIHDENLNQCDSSIPTEFTVGYKLLIR